MVYYSKVFIEQSNTYLSTEQDTFQTYRKRFCTQFCAISKASKNISIFANCIKVIHVASAGRRSCVINPRRARTQNSTF